MRNSGMLALILLLAAAACGSPPKKAEKPQRPDRAPDTFRVRFETTKGAFVVEVVRDWAPRGADRFHELVWEKYFDGVRFHRVIRRFIAQFGVSPNPKTNELWRMLRIQDDPRKESNKRGTIAFAHNGPATRTTQVFINLTDNSKVLDGSGFAPFGRVVEGMDVVDQLYFAYGELAPKGAGPDASRVELEGEPYIARNFPRLDTINRALLVNQ